MGEGVSSVSSPVLFTAVLRHLPVGRPDWCSALLSFPSRVCERQAVNSVRGEEHVVESFAAECGQLHASDALGGSACVRERMEQGGMFYSSVRIVLICP